MSQEGTPQTLVSPPVLATGTSVIGVRVSSSAERVHIISCLSSLKAEQIPFVGVLDIPISHVPLIFESTTHHRWFI